MGPMNERLTLGRLVLVLFGIAVLARAQTGLTDGVKAQITSGNAALASAQWRDAEKAFRSALELNGSLTAGYRGLGIALLRQNRLVEAATVLETGLKIDPALPGGYFLLGLARFGTGDLRAAISSLSEATARSPNDRQSLLYLARAHFMLDERSQSVEALNRLLSRAPDDKEALLLLSQADPSRAEEVGRRLLEIAADSYEAWQWRADDFEKRGQLAESVRAYQKAIDRSPSLAGTNFGLARVYVKMADYDSAREALRRELALNPFSSSASLLLGSLQVLHGEFVDALPHLQRATQSASTAGEAYINLGRAYLRLRKDSEALDALQRAVALRPDSKAAHYELALAYSRLGKKAEAEKSLAEFDRLRTKNIIEH
jgi:tetratricopeptide (TPR) repeat protein